MAVQVNFTMLFDKSSKNAFIPPFKQNNFKSSSSFEGWLMYTISLLLAILVIGSCVYHVMIYCRYYKHGFQKLNTTIFFDAYESKQKLMRSSFKQDNDFASSDDDDDEDYSLYNVNRWHYEKPT